MPVNLTTPIPAELHAVAGVEIGVAMAGVRKANRKDLVLFTLAEGSSVAAVFTRNRFCAAPVQVCRQHLGAGTPRRIVEGGELAGARQAGLLADLARLAGERGSAAVRSRHTS